MQTIRAFIIDLFRREIRKAAVENNREELQFVFGGGCLEFCILINRNDVLFVKDLARWSERFIIGNVRSHSGCGVVIGSNGAGIDRSAKVSLKEIRNVVRFSDPSK
jgi:hypothetical protein